MDSCHPHEVREWLVAHDHIPHWDAAVGDHRGVDIVGGVDVVAVGGAAEGSGLRVDLWRVPGTFGLVNWGCCPGACHPWESHWEAGNCFLEVGRSACWVGPLDRPAPSSFSCI